MLTEWMKVSNLKTVHMHVLRNLFRIYFKQIFLFLFQISIHLPSRFCNVKSVFEINKQFSHKKITKIGSFECKIRLQAQFKSRIPYIFQLLPNRVVAMGVRAKLTFSLWYFMYYCSNLSLLAIHEAWMTCHISAIHTLLGGTPYGRVKFQN